MSINVGIIGGAGYTGGELIRLLINHPDANIAFVHSNSNTGKYLYQVHHDLLGDPSLLFSGNEMLSANALSNIDILFLMLGILPLRFDQVLSKFAC